jgi:tRNA(Ile)-lysidine synthase
MRARPTPEIPAPRAAPAASPLTPVEFAAAMRQLGWAGDALALAVSGGPDSMALTLCAASWAKQHGVALMAFTLDHALRAESAAEANQVQRWLRQLGVAHHVLRWEHPPVTSAIQQQARVARYQLLATACRARGIRGLLLGHQLEDQAETVLLRFAKGSGVDGLAAMRPVTDFADIVLLRPLLGVPKARLIATCIAAGQAYVTDASNDKTHFARGRLRQAAQVLAAEGLTPERLADLAERAGLASDALACYANRLLAQAVFWHPAGYAELNVPRLELEPLDIRLRVVRRVLETIGGRTPLVRHAALLDVVLALQQPHLARRTLHGCSLRASNGVCQISRELAAITDAAPLAPGTTRLWDGRFQVGLAADAPPHLTLAKLGIVPQPVLDQLAPGLRQAVPLGHMRATLPALWQDGQLYAAPYYGRGAALFTCRLALEG